MKTISEIIFLENLFSIFFSEFFLNIFYRKFIFEKKNLRFMFAKKNVNFFFLKFFFRDFFWDFFFSLPGACPERVLSVPTACTERAQSVHGAWCLSVAVSRVATLRLVTRLLRMTGGKSLPSFPKTQRGLGLSGNGRSIPYRWGGRGNTIGRHAGAAVNSFYSPPGGYLRIGGWMGRERS